MPSKIQSAKQVGLFSEQAVQWTNSLLLWLHDRYIKPKQKASWLHTEKLAEAVVSFVF